MIIKLCLVIVLLISLYTDIRKMKILNIVIFPSVILAFIFYIITQGLEGFIFSLKGFAVGMGLLLIPYLLGGMGAGDVKLMAAIGALMGTSFVFYSFIYTALIGGVIALVLIIKRNGFKNTIKSLFYRVVFFRSNFGSISVSRGDKNKISFPYGVAIVLGTLINLIGG